MRLPLRIAIADDHGLCRDGLRALLTGDGRFTVVAETDCAAGVVPMLDGTASDVLLLDLQMDLSTAPLVGALARRISIVAMAAGEPIAVALDAIRAGARAVVPKRLSGSDLMAAIDAVGQGDRWIPAALQEALIRETRDEAEDALTAREREVARHVAAGLRNAEIARQLFISEQTVKTHLNNAFAKLGLRDRVELALFALRTGITSLSHEDPPQIRATFSPRDRSSAAKVGGRNSTRGGLVRRSVAGVLMR